MATRKKDKEHEEFGEYLPSYMQDELFPDKLTDQSEEEIHHSILRQLGLIALLLLLQIGLFYVLITSLLGFSL